MTWKWGVHIEIMIAYCAYCEIILHILHIQVQRLVAGIMIKHHRRVATIGAISSSEPESLARLGPY
jgi:hypothetical protein